MESIIPALVDEPTACQILGGASTPIHRSTLWRGIHAGRYPKPLKMGLAINRWRRDELLAMIELLSAARGRAA
jgi:predicted DNA-binding transcriptional regulator AlpA